MYLPPICLRNCMASVGKRIWFHRMTGCTPTKVMSDQVAKRTRMEEGSDNEVQTKSTLTNGICDLSTQEFSDVVSSEAFVDKTLLIKAFLKQRHSVIAALAPRRFGKSTIISMLIEFLSGNKKLFEDNQLKIWKEERAFFHEYCQPNPIIHVDFKCIDSENMDTILDSLKGLISDAFATHRNLIKKVDGKYSWSDEKLKKMDDFENFQQYWNNYENLSRGDVIAGLKKLSKCLNVFYGKPVYVFIDEYDLPIMEMIMKTGSNNKDLDDTIDLIGKVMSDLLENNKHVKKGLIMSCVRIAEVLSGNANNIQCYGFLNDPLFSPYFGFTDREVKSLFEKEEFVPFKDNKVKEWYNGYTLQHTDEYVIYSCYSVLNYLQRSQEMSKPCFENYWVDSGNITKLKELFAVPVIRKLIKALINGEEIEIRTIPKFSKDDIWTLQNLVHQKLISVDSPEADLFLQFLAENGYLNVVSTEDDRSTIRVPNNEIKKLLIGKLYNAKLLQKRHQLSSENICEYSNALNSLLKQRDRDAFIAFARALSKLFDGATFPNSENELHRILFTLAYNFKEYTVRSELSTQQKKQQIGRPPHLNLLVILKEVGMILELKFKDKSSDEAHCQIESQEYAKAFDNYKDVTEKIFISVHMGEAHKVSLTYSVNDLPRERVTSDD